MAPKIIKKVLIALGLREKKHEKYNYDTNMHLEEQGFFNEGLEGIYNCPTKNCKNLVYVYRQVRRQDGNFHDVLRFEQIIPATINTKIFQHNPLLKTKVTVTSHGKVSICVPVVWNGENKKEVGEKEYVGEVGKVHGKKYVLVKHRYFASIACVKCKKDLHLWDELRQFDGEDEMRWILARKEDNLGAKDVDEGSQAGTLVDGHDYMYRQY